jgi:hypothetical protein
MDVSMDAYPCFYGCVFVLAAQEAAGTGEAAE